MPTPITLPRLANGLATATTTTTTTATSALITSATSAVIAAVIAAVVTVLIASPAAADEANRWRFQVGPQIGVVGFPIDTGLGNGWFRYDVPSPGFALGLRASAIFEQRFGAELFGRYTPTSFRDPGDFQNPRTESDIEGYAPGGGAGVTGLRLLGRYNLPGTELVVPFVTAGVGLDRLSTSKKYVKDGDADTALVLGVGANIKLTHRSRLRLDASYFGAEGTARREDPRTGEEINAATSVSNGYEILAGVVFELGGPPGDDDKDGLDNEHDKCPDKAEDKDGYRDADGCPDPDNDGDGVPDTEDKCPNKAEDKDGFEDYDGCPEPDNDGDGVLDSKDRCPNQAEDKDGYYDKDGCPDPDNDGDKIPDKDDKCPNKAEDFDHFRDTDGCPEPDNDYDGVLDKDDKCPGKKENKNGYQDEDGCPDSFPEEVKALTSQPEYGFKFGRRGKFKARRSKKAIARILKVLNAYPAMKLEIHCHADVKPARTRRRRRRRPVPDAKLVSQELSVDRCEAIVEHLIRKGVKQGRLIIKARGNRVQLVPTEGLRRRAMRKALKKNNRVEYRMVP